VAGNPASPKAAALLTDQLYRELRALAGKLMRSERPMTLQPTALVHEAFLQLAGHDRIDWKGRTHFKAIAAVQMRRILCSHARRGQAAKRGGGLRRITLDERIGTVNAPVVDALDLERCLRQLGRLQKRHERVAELRLYAGLRSGEIADLLGVSDRTVRTDWRFIQAWLTERLGDGGVRP